MIKLGAIIKSFKDRARFSSTRARLLAFLVLLVLLPLVATSLPSVFFGWQNGRQQVMDQLTLAAKFKISEIESWTSDLELEIHGALAEKNTFEFARHILRWYRDIAAEATPSETLSEGLVTELEWRLNRYAQDTPLFENFLVVDLSGKIVASTLKPISKLDATVLKFDRALTGSYIYFPTEGEMAIVFGVPIFDRGAGPGDPQHEILGILIGQVDVASLNRIMFERLELGETGETYLLRSDYTPLTTLQFEEEPSRIYTRGSLAALKYHKNGAGVYADYRGVPVVGVYRWLPEVGLALLAEQDQAEAFRVIYQALTFNVVVALIAALGAVVAATFIARDITSPLVDLSRAASQVADGDLDHQVEIVRDDEIGTLGQVFNRMTVRLREMLRAEAERRQELEHEIAERQKAEAERQQLLAEQAALQQEVIEAQQHALRKLSTPIIPVMEHIIVMPLIGSINSQRGQDIMRALLTGISEHQARVVILDVTGVPVMDAEVLQYLNKTIQAARLKGTRAIVTGISDTVAETIVDGDWQSQGIDWGAVETLRDLQTGLRVALDWLRMGLQQT